MVWILSKLSSFFLRVSKPFLYPDYKILNAAHELVKYYTIFLYIQVKIFRYFWHEFENIYTHIINVKFFSPSKKYYQPILRSI